jgi:hypothetical protein
MRNNAYSPIKVALIDVVTILFIFAVSEVTFILSDSNARFVKEVLPSLHIAELRLYLLFAENILLIVVPIVAVLFAFAIVALCKNSIALIMINAVMVIAIMAVICLIRGVVLYPTDMVGVHLLQSAVALGIIQTITAICVKRVKSGSIK